MSCIRSMLRLVAVTIWFTAAYWFVCAGVPLARMIRLAIVGDQTKMIASVPPIGPFDTADDSQGEDPVASLGDNERYIPRIMHRTWKNSNLSTAPNRWWAYGDKRCRKLNKDWETILWTDQTARELIANEYAWFLPIYDGYRYNIQRVDAHRYFIVYHFGGVYMDLDVGCQRPLEPLRAVASKAGALLPETTPCGFSNDMIMASKRHPFFKRVITSLKAHDRWYGSAYPTVIFSTGPAFLSLQFQDAAPEERARVAGLSRELYSHDHKIKYFYHMEGNSWHENDAAVIMWLKNNHELLQSVLVLQLLAWGLLLLIVKQIRRKNRRAQKHLVV